MRFLLQTFITIPIFIVLDYVWLGLLMKSFYMRELGELARSTIHYGSAFAVYVVMALSLAVFVFPRIVGQTVEKAALMGAVLGFFVYAIYDFTNYATLRSWSWKFMIVDIAWGTAVYAITTGISYSLLRVLKLL